MMNSDTIIKIAPYVYGTLFATPAIIAFARKKESNSAYRPAFRSGFCAGCTLAYSKPLDSDGLSRGLGFSFCLVMFESG